MYIEHMQTRVTELEISALMNDENMLAPGRDIVRRMAFELTQLRERNWKDEAYAKLGAVRDTMTEKDVGMIQRFLKI